MADVIYRIVEHDGGWAYKLGDVFSETFPTHDDALTAARIVASEQRAAGEGGEIAFQDERGHWHHESSPGDDRPSTDVRG